MFKFKIKYLCLICAVFYHLQSIANDSLNSSSNTNISPFWVSADLPLMTGLGLPKALSAKLQKQGNTQVVINGIIKSNANDAGATNETLILDGESQSFELGLNYGLAEQWSLDLQVAYVQYKGGSLDGLIQNWHDAFGLSDGDRTFFTEDDLNFTYRRDGKQYQINKATSGFSDLRLGVGYGLTRTAEKYAAIDHLMLRSGLNLPAGDADKLTGSDKLDWDIGLYASGHSKKWSKLGWHANLGYLYIGDDSLFGIETKQHAWFNSLGLSWAISPKLQLKGQLDSHSAVFDSAIDELSRYASQLSLGMTYQSDRMGLIELYVSEDLTVNRAADFSLGLSIKFAL